MHIAHMTQQKVLPLVSYGIQSKQKDISEKSYNSVSVECPERVWIDSTRWFKCASISTAQTTLQARRPWKERAHQIFTDIPRFCLCRCSLPRCSRPEQGHQPSKKIQRAEKENQKIKKNLSVFLTAQLALEMFRSGRRNTRSLKRNRWFTFTEFETINYENCIDNFQLKFSLGD